MLTVAAVTLHRLTLFTVQTSSLVFPFHSFSSLKELGRGNSNPLCLFHRRLIQFHTYLKSQTHIIHDSLIHSIQPFDKMSHIQDHIDVWQYREPTDLSSSSSSISSLSTLSELFEPDTPATIYSTDGAVMSELQYRAQQLQNFCQWLLARPLADQKLFVDACCALVTDLDRNLATVDSGSGHSGAAIDDNGIPPLQLSSSPLAAANESAPTLSSEASGISELTIPRARPLGAGPRPSSAPSSSCHTSSYVSEVDADTLPQMPGLHGDRSLSTSTVVRHSPLFLPGTLYCGRTPPFWRWSEVDLPIVASQSTSTPAARRRGRPRNRSRDKTPRPASRHRSRSLVRHSRSSTRVHVKSSTASDSGSWQTITTGSSATQAMPNDNQTLPSRAGPDDQGRNLAIVSGSISALDQDIGVHREQDTAHDQEYVTQSLPHPESPKRSVFGRMVKVLRQKAKNRKQY